MIQAYCRIVFLLSFCFPMLASAQHTTTLHGKIRNTNKEIISGAHIKINNQSDISISDINGNYSLIVPIGKTFTLVITHISYKQFSKDLNISKGDQASYNPILKRKNEKLREITVNSKELIRQKNIAIDAKQLEQVPVSSNGTVEQIIKTLPGVSSNNELSSQYSVRGGNFDENLVYINGVEIHRPTLVRSGQQEGLSIINPDLVSSVQFSSGGFDAKYGDKLSSVLDIKYKKPSEFEGSVDASLLGGSAHLENISKNRKLSYLAGFRYKSNRYLLNSLDTKGDYQPVYTDFQTLINYQLNQKISIHFWGSISKNQYNFQPENRTTSFGTISDALQLKVFFEGEEKDEYHTDIEAITLKYRPNLSSIIRFTASRYNTKEVENFDIMGQYFLSDLFISLGGMTNESIQNLGIGTFIDHARNKLKREEFELKFRGDHQIGKLFLQWGIKGKSEQVNDRINEWQYQDSAGYAIPFSKTEVELSYARNASNLVNSKHLSSFTQASWIFDNSKTQYQVTVGLRYHYWDYSQMNFLSPRASIYFIPDWRNKVKFRISAGLYQQVPSYREMLKIDGKISDKIQFQKSVHYVLGQDYIFKAWNRPFKFTSELYYKDLRSITPYDIENLRIRYYGDLKAKGYAAGLDLRINGEFVPGTESWASLSLMKTQENIPGDNKGYIPRPTDERVNFAMFFQDYLPNNPSYKMHLSLVYGGKLPVWSPKNGDNFRMPNYRRIDLGFSKILIGENQKSRSTILRKVKSMWLSLEIFNVLDINNTVSYLWIKDISGNQYAIPNYLTSRKLNLKLSAKF